MPLSYQRKIHRGEIHPVTLHPCKRQEKLYLTEQRPDIPWIHLPSSGLVRIWSLGRSQQLFFCVFSHFRHGHEQTNNRVILVQACSWPVRRQSFAIKLVILVINWMRWMWWWWWLRRMVEEVVDDLANRDRRLEVSSISLNLLFFFCKPFSQYYSPV